MERKPPKALLKVGYACNNNCVFCHSAPHRGTDSSLAEMQPKIRQAASLGAGMLVLSGGEPTIRPDLLQIAGMANAAGMDLGLVTNGRMLSYPRLCDQLLERRLGYVYISLCGPDAALHDRHARADSFDQTIQGLENVARAVPDTTINVVVSAWNLQILNDFVQLAASLSPVRLKFSNLEPEGNALLDFAGLVPPLRRAAEAVVAAVERARTEHPQMEVAVDGFPLCLIDGHLELESGLREDGFFIMSEAFQPDWHPVDDRNRGFGEDCRSCSLRRRCRGVFKQYLKHRGAEELRPVSRPAPNSFNFAPAGEPESLDLDACPVRSGNRPPPDPIRGILLEAGPGEVLRHATTTRDFSDETVGEVVRHLGQVYLDRSGHAELADFASELVKLTPAAACQACPQRPLCGGVWRPGPDASFRRAREILSGLLSGLQGRVLEVGCGRNPDTAAFQPALQEGRVEYLGIDPLAHSGEPAAGMRLLATTLEDFQWTGPGFDAVVALRSLNHLHSLPAGLAKMASLAAAGARLVLAEDVVFATVRSRQKLEQIESRQDLPFQHRSNPFPSEVVPMLTELGLTLTASYLPQETASTLWIMVCEKERGGT